MIPVAEPVPVLRLGPSESPSRGDTSPPRTLSAEELARADRKGIRSDTRLKIAPVPAAPKSRRRQKPAAKNDSAVKAYQAAYDTMKGGDLERALKGFRAFGAQYPRHDLADNAQYWVGECLYADKNFKQALGEFRRVIDDYPDGNKVPDSLLKIALSYQSLGDGPTARYVLAQVVEIFPDSSAARVARERLERL